MKMGKDKFENDFSMAQKSNKINNKKITEKSEFAKNLSKIRKANNINQKELAKSIGVSQSYVARLENSKAIPNPDTLLNILSNFKFDMHELSKLILSYIDVSSMIKQFELRRKLLDSKISDIILDYISDMMNPDEFSNLFEEYDYFTCKKTNKRILNHIFNFLSLIFFEAFPNKYHNSPLAFFALINTEYILNNLKFLLIPKSEIELIKMVNNKYNLNNSLDLNSEIIKSPLHYEYMYCFEDSNPNEYFSIINTMNFVEKKFNYSLTLYDHISTNDFYPLLIIYTYIEAYELYSLKVDNKDNLLYYTRNILHLIKKLENEKTQTRLIDSFEKILSEFTRIINLLSK